MPIPFLVFGDGPRQPTGLARIARDLTMRLVAEAEDLGVEVCQVGIDEPDGWHWQGWDFYGYQPSKEDYGRTAVEQVVAEKTAATGERPIVLAIFDPSRVYDLTRRAVEVDVDDRTEGMLQADLWGYFPLDAMNPQQAIGGPAAEAVQRVQRRLAYGAWGAEVLERTCGAPVEWLPHGIETRVFTSSPNTDEAFRYWYDGVPYTLGCVATNQPRKDLGLLFATCAALKQRGHRIALWLHTDQLTTGAWDVGELARQFGLTRAEVLVTTGELSDQALAARYTCSDLTLAPGLGEGFGYPIVESLSCGTPVVHGHYAGGVELIPDKRWLVDPVAWRLESLYALQRPVFHPEHWATAVEGVLQQVAQDPQGVAAYCRGSVQYLDWQWVWPRWRDWIRAGLATRRKERQDG